jgi:hypothetical protein
MEWFGNREEYVKLHGQWVTDGQENAEDVTARHITDVRVIFTPGKRFAQVLDDVQFQKESAS